MTPQRTNQVGNAFFFALRLALFALAIWMAYNNHWIGGIFAFFTAILMQWKNDGKWFDDGEPPKQ